MRDSATELTFNSRFIEEQSTKAQLGGELRNVGDQLLQFAPKGPGVGHGRGVGVVVEVGKHTLPAPHAVGKACRPSAQVTPRIAPVVFAGGSMKANIDEWPYEGLPNPGAEF